MVTNWNRYESQKYCQLVLVPNDVIVFLNTERSILLTLRAKIQVVTVITAILNKAGVGALYMQKRAVDQFRMN